MDSYYKQASERLNYREVVASDVENWIDFFEKNNKLQFLGIDTSLSSKELAQEWIDRQLLRYSEEGYGHLIVSKNDTNEIIAMGGILPRMINNTAEFEIAYSVKPNFWGNGYATEIAKQLKSFAIENNLHHRVISMIHPENIESINVAKKNGMQKAFEHSYMGMPVEVYSVEL